jgi:hypothetical protein
VRQLRGGAPSFREKSGYPQEPLRTGVNREMNMNKPYAAVIACLSVSITAIAGQSPEIRYLIHEPASMLDLGLYKLRDAVSALVNDPSRLSGIGLKPPINVQATYDVERNQIHIFAGAPLPPSYLIRSKPRELCGQLVGLVRTWMISDRKWIQSFRHSGYTASKQADTAVEANLPGMIVIDAAVGSDVPAKTESCSSTLANPEVSYARPHQQ